MTLLLVEIISKEIYNTEKNNKIFSKMSVLHLNVGRLNVTCELNRADCTRTKNANRVISCIVITVF